MDGSVFDRITKRLAGGIPRRGAVTVVAATALAALTSRLASVEAVAKKNKKKRCRSRQQTCGGRKKCCNKSGLNQCGEFPTLACQFTGRHCCGVEGALCDKSAGNNFGNCDCCEGTVCVPDNGGFRCRSEAT
jgi:hypothetical protein